MANEKRIKDFEPASDIELDDWFAIDSPSAGTRKVQLAQMLEAIQTQVTAIADELGVLDGEVDTHDTSISNLQTKVGTAALTTEAPDLSGAVNELDSDFTNLIKKVTYTKSSLTVPPNDRVNVTGNDLGITIPSGYTPLGIAEVNTNNGNLSAMRFVFNTGSGIVTAIYNHASSGSITSNINVTVLYIKSDFVNVS